MPTTSKHTLTRKLPIITAGSFGARKNPKHKTRRLSVHNSTGSTHHVLPKFPRFTHQIALSKHHATKKRSVPLGSKSSEKLASMLMSLHQR
mmetsp:Transcript_40888/g.79625  ORF Transcript_40888/g.79625 Transcript_40888/m.79625 type:complete len:91 (+) Transcript_40888:724-996(+)